MQEQYEQQMQGVDVIAFLKTLPSVLPRSLLESASKMTEAAFSSLFRSYSFMALFLFAIMLILSKSLNLNGSGAEHSDPKRKKLLATASGITGVLLFLSFTLLRFWGFQRPKFSFWVSLPFVALYSFVPAFAFATFLHAIDAADRGKKRILCDSSFRRGCIFPDALLVLSVHGGDSFHGSSPDHLYALACLYGSFKAVSIYFNSRFSQ
jgi:cytochrome bd-type quinol oxidase subunit 2